MLNTFSISYCLSVIKVKRKYRTNTYMTKEYHCFKTCNTLYCCIAVEIRVTEGSVVSAVVTN